MSTTCAYTPPIKASTTTNNSGGDKRIEDSGTNAAPEHYQCCVCELQDGVFPGFGTDETCFLCGHAACSWCVVYTRVADVIMGA
jgi:hypothetical protein